METLACCLHPGVPDAAVILTGRSPETISHAALADNVTSLRQQLRSHGLCAGRRIAIVLSSPHLFMLAFLATTLQSCIAGPLNHNLKAPEFEFYYADFKADVVVLSEDDVSKSSQAFVAAKTLKLPIITMSVKNTRADMNFSDLSFDSKDGELKANTPALVLHTSGTTGRPKAVPLSHGNLCASIANIQKHYQFTSSDRTSIIMPLFHIHGIVCALLTPLAIGAAVIVPRMTSGITPSFLRDAVTHGVTWYTATPTLHRLVLKIPGDAPKFRFIRSCSSPLDVGLLKELEQKFECIVVEAYAMTEAAHQVCSNPVSELRREGSVGVPTGTDVRILDEHGGAVEDGHVGEICIRGPNLMDGYLDNEQANRTSFVGSWFRTGDQGKFDQGFLRLTGRIKELINKGGEKIGPVEVDAVVNRHDSVAEAVTFAIPDDMYGEEVAVAIVLEAGRTVTERELKTWIGERLAQAKVPKRVYFVDSIPKTAVGKMQRSLVTREILQRET